MPSKTVPAKPGPPKKDDPKRPEITRAYPPVREGQDGRGAKDVPGRRPAVAFPKKNQPPTPAAFAARLPLVLGKRFDAVRSFLSKQKGVTEDVYFYGPRSGWALRYLLEGRPLCALLIHDEKPTGLLSVDPATSAVVDWKGLSPAAQKAKKAAHGSPPQLWLDVPLADTGAADFKQLVKAKLAVLTDP